LIGAYELKLFLLEDSPSPTGSAFRSGPSSFQHFQALPLAHTFCFRSCVTFPPFPRRRVRDLSRTIPFLSSAYAQPSSFNNIPRPPTIMSGRHDVEAQRERARKEERDRRGMQPPPSRAPAAPVKRMHEWFIPKNGIDREVITADIQRYLGNDALVRPGVQQVSLQNPPP
jgi:hypothetical protein